MGLRRGLGGLGACCSGSEELLRLACALEVRVVGSVRGARCLWILAFASFVLRSIVIDALVVGPGGFTNHGLRRRVVSALTGDLPVPSLGCDMAHQQDVAIDRGATCYRLACRPRLAL